MNEQQSALERSRPLCEAEGVREAIKLLCGTVIEDRKQIVRKLSANPTDRYIVYKILGGELRIAFCWSYVRRDFVRIHDSRKRLRAWAAAWVERINDLFAQNAKRIAVLANPDAFRVEDQVLREAVATMAQLWKEELADETLHPAPRKALNSLRKHWDGLTLFVDHPEVPMDNNEAERRLRNPVVGRKNYYGSGSLWSGALTAALFMT